MSVAESVEAAPKAVEATAKGLVGLVKAHPGGALVVFAVVVLIVLRYRNPLASLVGKVPVIGTPLTTFATNANGGL